MGGGRKVARPFPRRPLSWISEFCVRKLNSVRIWNWNRRRWALSAEIVSSLAAEVCGNAGFSEAARSGKVIECSNWKSAAKTFHYLYNFGIYCLNLIRLFSYLRSRIDFNHERLKVYNSYFFKYRISTFLIWLNQQRFNFKSFQTPAFSNSNRLEWSMYKWAHSFHIHESTVNYCI